MRIFLIYIGYDYMCGFQKKGDWYKAVTFIVPVSPDLNPGIPWRAYTIHLSATLRQWLMSHVILSYNFISFQN